MLHDPREQLESLVSSAVTALLVLPDEERAPLLTEMRVVVFRRAAETYGLGYGHRFAGAFVNAVAIRIDEAWQREHPEAAPHLHNATAVRR